ncbi:VOC family protein [Alistipes sp.]|uniref:VOC family protein n=1 Tax=Alistipes sp. TaxID=1872444 RepID=UPI003AEFA49F
MKLTFEAPLLAVRDVERSKRFYCELFDQKVVLDFGENVTFSDGFAIQEGFDRLTGIPRASIRERPHNMELYFETNDLEAFMQKLEALDNPVELLHPPRTYPWRQRVVRLYDPDGHLIEVGEAMQIVVRRCLREGLTPQQTAEITQHPLEFVLRCAEECK